MGLKVVGILEIEEMLTLVDTDVPRRVFKSLVKSGKKIQELAKEMAPVDEGHLEDAIMLAPEEGAAQPRVNGKFAKKEVEVYIDMSAPGTPNKRTGEARSVGDYAYYAHEETTPAGPNDLGPESRAKQGSVGVVVGGGFMVRAAEAADADIDAVLGSALDGL